MGASGTNASAAPGAPWRPLVPRSSVNFLPVIALERVNEGEKHTQEDEHDDADADAFELGGLTHVVEVVDEVADQPLILDTRERPGGAPAERLHQELASGRRLDRGEPLGADRRRFALS